MFGWLKGKSSQSSVEPVQLEESTERAYRQAWGFSALEWAGMSPEQRRGYRDSVSFAPYVAGVK